MTDIATYHQGTGRTAHLDFAEHLRTNEKLIPVLSRFHEMEATAISVAFVKGRFEGLKVRIADGGTKGVADESEVRATVVRMSLVGALVIMGIVQSWWAYLTLTWLKAFLWARLLAVLAISPSLAQRAKWYQRIVA